MSAVKKAVLNLVGNNLTSTAEVREVDTVAASYRRVILASPAFVGARWEPAAKIQLDAGDWDLRTYTPIAIDPEAGTAELLFYIHDDSLASRWVERTRVGMTTRVTSPKPSLSLTDLAAPVVFFGDETSFAAAATLRRFLPGERISFAFEVSDEDQATVVTGRFGLNEAILVQRGVGDAHIERSAALLKNHARAIGARHIILTGNARSIQALRVIIKTWEGDRLEQRTKAYWSPGKIGLD